jgi:hypothetical protein
MDVEQFRDIFLLCSTEVADKFYPKGQTDQHGEHLPDRGEYLRDQGYLYVLLTKTLAAKGFLDEHRDTTESEVPGPAERNV